MELLLLVVVVLAVMGGRIRLRLLAHGLATWLSAAAGNGNGRRSGGGIQVGESRSDVCRRTGNDSGDGAAQWSSPAVAVAARTADVGQGRHGGGHAGSGGEAADATAATAAGGLARRWSTNIFVMICGPVTHHHCCYNIKVDSAAAAARRKEVAGR